MSFILDALKKSENERARQNGPALFEARVLPPRRGVPVWAIVVGIILAANLALLAWVLMRTPAAVVAVAPPAAAPAIAAPPAPTPAPASTPPPSVPLPAPTIAAPPTRVPTYDSPPPAAAVVNPADYAPARPAGATPRTAPPPSRSGGYGLDPTLPTAQELSASGAGLPALRLALHAYAEDPAERYVLINSQRLREGETTGDGARVETIAPEGVLMSWRGQRFRLLPGE